MEGRATGPLSPTKAFAVLLALAAAAGAFLFFTTPDDPSPTTPTTIPESTNFALTNEEAIARFRELDALRLRAYEKRDPSMIPLYVTSDSPLRRVGEKEIESLLRDDVVVKPRFVTKRISVKQNRPDELIIRQLVMQDPRFFLESGKEITRSTKPRQLTIDWTLQLDDGQWKIHDSRVVASSSVSRRS